MRNSGGRARATVRCARTFLLIVTNNSRVWAGRPPWTVEGVKARWFNAVSLAAAGRLPHPIYPLPSASLQSAHGILSLFTRFWWSSAGTSIASPALLDRSRPWRHVSSGPRWTLQIYLPTTCVCVVAAAACLGSVARLASGDTWAALARARARARRGSFSMPACMAAHAGGTRARRGGASHAGARTHGPGTRDHERRLYTSKLYAAEYTRRSVQTVQYSRATRTISYLL